MLKTSLIALGMLAALAGASTRVSAQELIGTPIAAPVVGGVVVGAPLPIASGSELIVNPGGVVLGAPAGYPYQAGPIHPYSYYIDFPNPARTYVPYGPTDTFTYQGQAYGHAYDRWTWPAMSNASPGLGRYYQLLH
ncbi:hypothetical protein [Paludisphaera soli]|uniref:hypothetical protein n=1 Tax=Paludisphaera soli TaxID=2712865 RepID=UPI0013E9FF24|nr:hypothetical protein [Paludisphaera soli]